MSNQNAPSISQWKALAEKELRNKSIDQLTKETADGIQVKPVYSSDDLDSNHASHQALPGFLPFTRGPRATMYANRPWTIRQYAGFSTARESNQFYRQA